MEIKQIPITPTYKKENGLWVLDIDNIEIPFDIKKRLIVNIPPGQIGANHKHQRQEAFIGFGEELELVWKQDGCTKTAKMNPKGEIILFLIPPLVEHAVINNSKTANGVLFEFNDGIQGDTQACKVV